MFHLTPPSAKYFDFYRTGLGLFLFILFLCLSFDRSLQIIYGNIYYLSIVLACIASLFFALNIKRHLASLFILICLAHITIVNPAALRVITGYIGWFMVFSLFVPCSEGSFIRKKDADPNWEIKREYFYSLVLVFGVSFFYSGLFKLSIGYWAESMSFHIFSQDVRSAWMAERFPAWLLQIIEFGFNKLTIPLELFFLPLYLFKPTRKATWWLSLLFFIGIFFVMNIYFVASGMILFLIAIYPFKERCVL